MADTPESPKKKSGYGFGALVAAAGVGGLVVYLYTNTRARRIIGGLESQLVDYANRLAAPPAQPPAALPASTGATPSTGSTAGGSVPQGATQSQPASSGDTGSAAAQPAPSTPTGTTPPAGAARGPVGFRRG